MTLESKANDLVTTAKSKLNTKQIRLLEQWLNSWNFYLAREATFQPHRNKKYNPGDIVTVCFGYNVGSEQGGNRPAVVIEDNTLSDKTVMVVPLASIHPGTEEIQRANNVYLGELTDFNTAAQKEPGTETKVLINQMRAVSKQRIIKPTKNKEQTINIGNNNLKNIYSKINELYTSKYI